MTTPGSRGRTGPPAHRRRRPLDTPLPRLLAQQGPSHTGIEEGRVGYGPRESRPMGGRERMADSNQAVEQEDQQADATGHDSAEGKAQQREEEDPIAAAGDEKSEEREKAQEKEEQRQAAREKMDEIEEDPPDKLED